MLGFDPYREPDPTQLSFAFDSFAKQRTEQALLKELPDRIGSRHPSGVPLAELFASVTNETPATKDMLRNVVSTLCREGDLSKVGSRGEQRQLETAVRDDDIITVAMQTRIRW